MKYSEKHAAKTLQKKEDFIQENLIPKSNKAIIK